MRAVNLVPAAQRGGGGSAAGESQGAAYAILGVLAGLAVLAFLYGSAKHQISSRQARAATLSSEAQQAQAKATALAPYVSFAALREQRMQAVTQLVDSRFDWAHAFHELGRVLPSGASLTSLDGTIGSASTAAGAPASASATTPAATSGSVSSATPPGSVPTFTISGCATSQDEVAQTLIRLRLIDGVSDVKLQSSTKGAGSAGAASGNCGSSDPVFSVQVAFQPLPSAAASPTTTPATDTADTTPSSTGSGTAR